MDYILLYAVPLFYLILLSAVLTRLKWISAAGFGKRFIVLFFLSKCVAGFAYNWVALHLIPYIGDLLLYFDDGHLMYRSFLQTPSRFFFIYFQYLDYSDMDLTRADSGFIQSAFELIKLFQAILCLFTGGNLFANTILFNFAAVLCCCSFWRYLRQQFPVQGLVAGLLFFLLPSMFFYSAGITKEGCVLSLLCLLIPATHHLITQAFSLPKTLLWLLLFTVLFSIKFYVAALWLICMLLWRLLLSFRRRQGLVLAACSLLLVALFFLTGLSASKANLVAYLVERQQQFMALPASSTIYVVPLTTQPASFVKALPVALNNVLLKPLPGEGGKTLFLLYFVELLLFWGMLALLFVQRQRQQLGYTGKAILLVLFAFAMYNLLFTGFIVPNLGALVRYRSIFMPFLLMIAVITFYPTLLSGKWERCCRQLVAR